MLRKIENYRKMIICGNKLILALLVTLMLTTVITVVCSCGKGMRYEIQLQK